MTKAVWTKFITDNSGAVVEGASVTVFLSDGITPATIYSDPAGTSKANPFLTPAGGKAEFYADPGIYVIQASKDGKTATWNNEEIGHARRDLDLSDLESAATARANLGLGTAATATVTTTSTDTTAGRLLKVGDFGLTDKPIDTYPSGINIDDPSLAQGRYRIFSDQTTGTLPPGLGNFMSYLLEVTQEERTFPNLGIKQELSTLRYSSNRSFVRLYDKTTLTWTPWREIYNQSSILGTVSQSGGVPTGAIIERGSNVNGEYTKFADGTLFAWGVLSAPAHTANASRYYDGSATLPTAPLSSSGSIDYCIQDFRDSVWGTGFSTASNGFISIESVNPALASGVMNYRIKYGSEFSSTGGSVYFQMIGRWY